MEFSSNDLKNIKGEGERCSVNIIIHKTGGDKSELDESTTTSLPRNEIVDTSQYGGVPFQLSNFSVGENMLDSLRYFVIFSALSWGGLFCLWLGFKKQGKSEYIHRLYSVATVTFYELTVGVLANIFGNLCSRSSHKSTWCNMSFNRESYGSSEKFSDVELSTYKDQTHLSSHGSVPVVPVEDPLHLSAAALQISEGRPLVENILEDLDVGKSCAMFYCVPEPMSKNLREVINRKSISDTRYNAIEIYQESFEK